MNRLERLINLVAALLEADRPLSRADIQQLVPGYDGPPETSRRGFERDKETLRGMGIPLLVEPLDPGRPELGEGYRVRRDQYALADPGLNAEELAALHLAASVVRLEGASGQEAIWKLGGAPSGDHGNGEVGNGPVTALPGSEHLATLFAAMSGRVSVHFMYPSGTPSGGAASEGARELAERAVDPFRLSFANGRWYLEGHDHHRAGERRFRLDRMKAPRLGRPQVAVRRRRADGGRNQPWRMGEEAEVEALLLVDADQADWAVARVGEEAVMERRADGAVVLALGVANKDAFRSFVLGFLDHAEVLAPPELRSEMVGWLQNLAYGDRAA